MIKRLLLGVLLNLLAISAFATTTQIVGTLVDATGNPLNGVACFKLPVNAIDTSTSRALSPVQVCFNVTNGTFPSFANLTPNDVIQPLNTYYQVTVRNSSRTLIFSANYVIPTGGGTFNIGQATPTTITTTNISFLTPGLLNSTNTWTQVNNFQAGVTFSALALFAGQVAFTGDNVDWVESASVPTPGAGTDTCYGDAVFHALRCSYNAGAYFNQTQTLQNGTGINLGTSVINAGTCATPVNVPVTGLLSTDAVHVSFQGAPTGAYLTGLTVLPPDVSAGSFNIRVCNPTAGNLTPPAQTMNSTVVR